MPPHTSPHLPYLPISPQEVYRLILKLPESGFTPPLDECIESGDAIDLVEQLLVAEPSRRLGALPSGSDVRAHISPHLATSHHISHHSRSSATPSYSTWRHAPPQLTTCAFVVSDARTRQVNAILSHPFFSSIAPLDAEQGPLWKRPAPYTPTIKHETDTSQFGMNALARAQVRSSHRAYTPPWVACPPPLTPRGMPSTLDATWHALHPWRHVACPPYHPTPLAPRGMPSSPPTSLGATWQAERMRSLLEKDCEAEEGEEGGVAAAEGGGMEPSVGGGGEAAGGKLPSILPVVPRSMPSSPCCPW